MKKLHTAIKNVIFTTILASFLSDQVISMEMLVDGGIAKLIKEKGEKIAAKAYRKTSYASVQKKPEESPSATNDQNSSSQNECPESEKTGRG